MGFTEMFRSLGWVKLTLCLLIYPYVNLYYAMPRSFWSNSVLTVAGDFLARASPRHQQPWYWYKMGRNYSFIRKNYYLSHSRVREWYKIKIHIYVNSWKFSLYFLRKHEYVFHLISFPHSNGIGSSFCPRKHTLLWGSISKESKIGCPKTVRSSFLCPAWYLPFSAFSET